jgi:hypothetical protein
MAGSYRATVLDELVRNRVNHHADNFDSANLGTEPPPEPPVWRTGLARTLAYYLTPRRHFAETAADHIARGEFLYGILPYPRCSWPRNSAPGFLV